MKGWLVTLNYYKIDPVVLYMWAHVFAKDDLEVFNVFYVSKASIIEGKIAVVLKPIIVEPFKILDLEYDFFITQVIKYDDPVLNDKLEKALEHT